MTWKATWRKIDDRYVTGIHNKSDRGIGTISYEPAKADEDFALMCFIASRLNALDGLTDEQVDALKGYDLTKLGNIGQAIDLLEDSLEESETVGCLLIEDYESQCVGSLLAGTLRKD
jgi:hypothetical protein